MKFTNEQFPGWLSFDEAFWEHADRFQNGVCVLAPPLDTIPSPHGNAIYTLEEHLAEHCPIPCLVLAAWPAEGQPDRCKISDRILYCRQPFRPIPLEKHIPYRIKKMIWGSGRPEIIHYARQAAKMIQALQLKIVVIEDIPLYAWVVRRYLGGEPLIFLHQHCNAPQGINRNWWEKIAASLNGIVFVAEESRKATEQIDGKLTIPSQVVYNGVDLNHYDPDAWQESASILRQSLGIRPDEHVLLYVGRMIPGKGPVEAVEAFIEANVPNWRFVLVGPLIGNLYQDDLYLERLKKAARGSNDRILLIGAVGQEELPAYYTLSDLVIVPSIQSEGLPKVVTEALAMGKPVIASNRGGIGELVDQDRGWFIDPQDPSQFSASLRMILSDNESFRRKQAECIKCRNMYSLVTSAEKFWNFILGRTPDGG